MSVHETPRRGFGLGLLCGCRVVGRFSPIPFKLAVKEKHYKPIYAYQEYAEVGFIIALHSTNNDKKLFLTPDKKQSYQNWQF